ncbi:MAG: hypothetical protein KBG28_24710 [Kofleriaceae bacterium]|nr:hypothetical protein [Kofleriaceae bacterium]MBP9207193.1 hypothetical protein [Kofleriaceae bacterium]
MSRPLPARRAAALALAALTAGCVADPADGGAGDGASGPGRSQVVAAPAAGVVDELVPFFSEYLVAVPPALEGFGLFTVHDAVLVRRHGVVELRHSLPAELLGQVTSTRFIGSLADDGVTAELTSELGTASCRIEWPTTTCTVAVPGLSIDLDAVAAHLAGSPDAAARLEVASSFAADPVGVLSAYLDPAF